VLLRRLRLKSVPHLEAVCQVVWSVGNRVLRPILASERGIGAGDGTRTRDILLGRYIALNGVAQKPEVERNLSSYQL
jgi:hypothetical protein